MWQNERMVMAVAQPAIRYTITLQCYWIWMPIRVRSRYWRHRRRHTTLNYSMGFYLHNPCCCILFVLCGRDQAVQQNSRLSWQRSECSALSTVSMTPERQQTRRRLRDKIRQPSIDATGPGGKKAPILWLRRAMWWNNWPEGQMYRDMWRIRSHILYFNRRKIWCMSFRWPSMSWGKIALFCAQSLCGTENHREKKRFAVERISWNFPPTPYDVARVHGERGVVSSVNGGRRSNAI